MKINNKNLTLPEWAFLDAKSHLGNELKGRTVILHIPSSSLIEIIYEYSNKKIITDDVDLTYYFKNYRRENMIALLHCCPAFKDRQAILDNILIPCAEFYSEYTRWEDCNIMDYEFSKLN